MDLNRKKLISSLLFFIFLTLGLSISFLYLYNIIRWANSGDRGFYFRSTTGIQTVGITTEPGRIAGIKIGDRVLRVNGKAFSNIKDFYDAMHWEIGRINTYLIERDAKQFEIHIPIARHGYKVAFTRSGLYFLVGLFYLITGGLVFMMRPHYKASWIFFVSCAFFGLLITFFVQMGEIWPAWLGTIHIFLYALSPATYIHLAMHFPEKRHIVEKHPYVEYLPYVLSAILFLGIRSSTQEIVGISKGWFLILMAYYIPALMIFLASCLYSWLRSTSEMVKVRSKLILLGAVLTASLPVSDMLTNVLWDKYIVSSYNFYLPFLMVFPIFAGYTIIKHNLFDIDAIIRRTFGYILSTTAIAIIYTLFVFVPALIFGKFESTGSHAFLLAGFLFVFFIFNLVRNRVQRFVDRIFFRLEYNYYETLQNISESMKSLMNLNEIGAKVLDFIQNILFIEKGCILLADPNGSFEVIAGYSFNRPLTTSDPLIRRVMNQKMAVSRYDIEGSPFCKDDRAMLLNTFSRLGATLVVPIIFESRLVGLMSLGGKKSGKFYRYGDINMLKTLANQAAIAITNARLHESRLEAIENSRREIEQLGKVKSKALDHLSHELITPISLIRANIKRLHRRFLQIETGSDEAKIFEATTRQLNRLAEIQQKAEKIINSYADEKQLAGSIKARLINPISDAPWAIMPYVENRIAKIRRQAAHRRVSIALNGEQTLHISITKEIIDDFLHALLKNAIENTPDEGLIQVACHNRSNFFHLSVHDYGIGITEENQRHIFSGLFPAQAIEIYSSRKPFDFNAGGKGLDLYRLKAFSIHHGFGISATSRRCIHIPTDLDVCPGKISECRHCTTSQDCLTSGGSEFCVSFHSPGTC